jgi:acetyltransferase
MPLTNLADHPLHPILHPRSVVVAGASTNPSKMGSVLAMNAMGNGFRGEVVFLHPEQPSLFGRPAYRTPADLPFVPDLALLVTPAAVTPDLLDALGARGVRHAVVISGGFAEVGPDGAARGQRLKEAADRHGLRFVGPNCIGVLNTHHPFNCTVLSTLTGPGPLGLVSQSGTFVSQLPMLLAERGIRYGKAVSVGNSANVDLVDLLEYLGSDPATTAIALYIEGLPDARRFRDVAREVTCVKPVFALYAGGTAAGRRAGLSHTANLGGADGLYDGLFAEAGVIRAGSVSDLFDWSWAAAVMPPPRGPRTVVLTHSGGPATCMADECERQGLAAPELSPALQEALRPHVFATASVRNPIDLTWFLDNGVFAETLPRLLLESDEVDALLVHGLMDTGFLRVMYDLVSQYLPIDRETMLGMARVPMQPLLDLVRASGKPLLASTFVWDDDAARELRAGGVPLMSCPHAAVRALGALYRAGRLLGRDLPPAADASPLPIPDLAALSAAAGATPGARVALDEAASKHVLSHAGVDLPPEAYARTLDEAREAAALLGWPVVMKGLAPGVAHKTEAGLVHLALADEAALEHAWQAIEQRAPGCLRLLAPMLQGDRELVIGLTRAPGFGPVVMLGVGGVYAEALSDAVFRLAPVTASEAAGMVDHLRAARLFGDVRGRAALDREALARILVAVGRLGAAHPQVAEIDLNPVMVGPDGVPRVADALVVVQS